MRVLVVGAAGNFGSRFVVALLAHGHDVVGYVRNEVKLAEKLPASTPSRITVLTGDAEDVDAMKDAMVLHKVDAVVGCAGIISLPGSHPSRVAEITVAVAKAAQQAGDALGKPVRLWLLSGQLMMEFPPYGKTYEEL
jgi:nucleoside-diphosphate-sugar epimerase